MSPACSIRLVKPERLSDLQFFYFNFEFFGRKWGHKQGMCIGCGGRSFFFHSGKEFGHVLCTFPSHHRVRVGVGNGGGQG